MFMAKSHNRSPICYSPTEVWGVGMLEKDGDRYRTFVLKLKIEPIGKSMLLGSYYRHKRSLAG